MTPQEAVDAVTASGGYIFKQDEFAVQISNDAFMVLIDADQYRGVFYTMPDPEVSGWVPLLGLECRRILNDAERRTDVSTD